MRVWRYSALARDVGKQSIYFSLISPTMEEPEPVTELTEMKEQLATYALLCATVPGCGLTPQLVDALRRGDKSEFRTLLSHAFWMLVCCGLEHPRSRDLWTQIVMDYSRREQ